MAGKTHAQPYIVDRVIQKGWDFLNNNFENFTTTQKIHIALELCKKSMPDKHEHDVNFNIHEVLKAGENRIGQYLGKS